MKISMSVFEKQKKEFKLVILYGKDKNVLLIIHKFPPNPIYTKTHMLQQFETRMISKQQTFKTILYLS